MKPLVLAALLSCSAITTSASFAWSEEACPTAVPAGCGSECQSAYRDYAAANASQRWDIPLYEEFLERFNEVSVQVKAKSESGDSFVKSMCLSEWYASYKYRETQMDKKAAWDGVAKMFETERADYAKGQSEARKVYADLAGKQDWKDGGQLKKELGRRLSSRYGKSVLSQDRDGDGKRLFPGALAAEDLRTIDFLYVYLSSAARDSLDSSSCAKNGKCPQGQGLAQNVDQRNRAQQRGEKAVADAGIAAPVFSAPFLGEDRAAPPPARLPSVPTESPSTKIVVVDAPAAPSRVAAAPSGAVKSPPLVKPISTSQAAAGANPRIDQRTPVPPPPFAPAHAAPSIAAASTPKPAASSSTGQVKAPPASIAAAETPRHAAAAPRKQIAGARRIVFVGDSHSAQYFGRTLDQDLRSTGDLVATFAVAGSMPSAWTSGAELCMGSFFKVDPRMHQRTEATRKNDAGATCVKTPRLAELVGGEYKPDVVIIALGSNGVADAASLLKILHSAPSRPACYWVGPPRMRAVKDATLDSRYSDLARAGITDSSSPIDSCRLIDSRLSYLHYPAEGCDGIHYNCSDLIPLAKRWGHDVDSAIARSLNKH